jgi:hypothetical protein
LTSDLDDELVIYDTERKKAHSLNRTATLVWRYCDGQHTIKDLQRVVSAELGLLVEEEAIVLALRQLDQAHLLVDRFQPTGQNLSRREMLRKARRMGAAAVVLPAVVSALVPVPAAALSCVPCNELCIPNVSKCCSPCQTCTLAKPSKDIFICV